MSARAASFSPTTTASSTPPVRAAILKATADDVWGNYRGFMIGDGVIWFDGIVPTKPGRPYFRSRRKVSLQAHHREPGKPLT